MKKLLCAALAALLTALLCACAASAPEATLVIKQAELTQEEQAFSDGMAAAFAQYINSLGLTDENGVALTLTASENGICQSGT